MKLDRSVIGIELGSTRIKAVMIDEFHTPVAQGEYLWENRLVDGIWTYGYEEIEVGLQSCFSSLKKDFEDKTGEKLRRVGAIGISAMMHGYIPTDKDFRPLREFRTWRNTITAEAAEKATKLFDFNIPQRWSIAHLYQEYLKGEEYLKDLCHVETLSSFVHRLLTGENVIGIDDASGMFPIDIHTKDFDAAMAELFFHETGFDIFSLFPKVLVAGKNAGFLTTTGARILDREGDLEAGIPMAPPEGDAGTGMVATNSIRVETGNVSAGTSDFAMVVTDKKLSVHREIDIVTTPSGSNVAMVHCNNCTTDINAWVGLFGQFARLIGKEVDKSTLYGLLYSEALKGKKDADSLLSCNYYSGEGVTDFNSGMPIFLHPAAKELNLPDFMRSHLMSALVTLKIGLDILKKEEVPIRKMFAHGGYFKVPKVGQTLMSAAINAPVSVMETAGEGGPYGMALLSSYMISGEELSLEDYLDQKVFRGVKTETVMAEDEDVNGFEEYTSLYQKLLKVERLALEVFNA